MRLRYGPHAGRLAEMVLLRDPAYVLRCMAERPQGVLAAVFAELIARLDERPFCSPCRRCGARAVLAVAYARLSGLAPLCDRCSAAPEVIEFAVAHRIVTVEDALRHVVETVPRAQKRHMARIVRALVWCKGGPLRPTERSALAVFAPPSASRSASRLSAQPRKPPAAR